MTIAISLKVNDGLVLAADSASTLTNLGPTGEPTSVVNVYEHANKIFNLRKGLPIGAITWGSGNIGNASISTLAKDLRRRFMGQEPDHEDWHIDPANYSIQEIAGRVREFMYEEHYVPSVADWPETIENEEGEQVPLARPELGFIVAGYSPGKSLAEDFRILIENGSCSAPEPVWPTEDGSGAVWHGQPEALTRLLLGMGTELPLVLQHDLEIAPDQVKEVVDLLSNRLGVDLVQPAMPFQDAIDLAEFFVDLTIQFTRFGPGAPTVGGPIEIAAISKHEGFKWIKRKHYFNDEFNPPLEEQ